MESASVAASSLELAAEGVGSPIEDWVLILRAAEKVASSAEDCRLLEGDIERGKRAIELGEATVASLIEDCRILEGDVERGKRAVELGDAEVASLAEDCRLLEGDIERGKRTIELGDAEFASLAEDCRRQRRRAWGK
jgi:hypothetical protein